jgi:excisionase family DNA binding protein
MTRTYSADEVAERLDRHTESIRRNLRKGQLDGKKWSNKWVIPEDALKEWLPEEIFEQKFGPEAKQA